MFSRVLVLTLLVLTLPIGILFLLLAYTYKVLCSVIIKRKDKLFVDFLDGLDVFWCLEDTSKSVVQILGIVESETPDVIASDIKQRLQNIFTNKIFKKIFYRRNEDFGFFYWQQYENIDINQYVQFVELPKREKTGDSINELQDLMTDLQNQSLPYEDKGLFKILITRQRVGKYDKERGEYGMICRIHHSVGDGVAITEFLTKILGDQSEDHSALFSFPKKPKKVDSAYNILEMMYKMLRMSVYLVDVILRKPDDSTLHGPNLSGKQVFKWSESDEGVLVLVKEIKDKIDKVNFTDILLTALSSGLQSFFSETMAAAPKELAVVLPVRVSKPSAKNEEILKNDFGMTILDLPLIEDNSTRFNTIKNQWKKIRESPDSLTNYYLMKMSAGILPKSILQPLLYSNQATMVFSNMPGPAKFSICGNPLKEFVAFVPLKGTTGVAVTSITYGGVLRFAATADTALVPTENDLEIILKGMVREIKRLHSLYGVRQTTNILSLFIPIEYDGPSGSDYTLILSNKNMYLLQNIRVYLFLHKILSKQQLILKYRYVA